MSRRRDPEMETSVSVSMGSGILWGTIMILTSPCWLPPVVAIHSKQKYKKWRGRKARAQYLATRGMHESTCVDPYPLLVDIENKTGRTITIETGTAEQNLAKSHSQDQSPLFALPAELRTLIFEFTLSSKTDEFENGLPFPTSKPVCGVNLLLTCRRAWLEANKLGIKYSRPVIWVIDPIAGVRGSLHDGQRIIQQYFRRLSATNAASMKHIRIVASLAWLPGCSICRLIAGAQFQWPEKLTLTFWHAGQSMLSIRFNAITDATIIHILRQAKAAGVRVLKLEFMAQTRQETHLLDAFLRYLTNATAWNLTGWHPCEERQWASLPSDTQNLRRDYLIKSLEWLRNSHSNESPWIPAHQTCIYTRSSGSHRKCIDEDQVDECLSRWAAEGSLLKFV